MLQGHYQCYVNLLYVTKCESGSILNVTSCLVLPHYAITFMAYTLFTAGKIMVPHLIMAPSSLVLFIVLIIPELNISVLHRCTRGNMTFGAHPLSGKHGNCSAHWAAPWLPNSHFNPLEHFHFFFCDKKEETIDCRKGKLYFFPILFQWNLLFTYNET